ncbi:MAG: dipicolinate synthase subunit B [Clostridiales bacterium]|jgi:dipicolinate synthase subunit B|nr:dipicolinate synthase subunit B [Clostridiales bacterium]
MKLLNKKIGFAMTGSFCTLSEIMDEIKKLVAEGAAVTPIMSENAVATDTRFGSASHWLQTASCITGNDVITAMPDAEPIGPRKSFDALVVAPCTGNTIAKLANGITDTVVTMAVKAHLRNDRPVILSVSSNDALGANAKNIGLLLNAKNIFFVPFFQDDPFVKSKSLLSKNSLIASTVEHALEGRQIQPVLAV